MRYTAPYYAAPVVHINGWQGSGKRTIAAELAVLSNARLLDNHSLLSIAQSLFERGTPEFIQLRQNLRDIAFEHALTLPPDMPLILTDAFSAEPYEQGLFAQVQRFAKTRSAPLITVVLDIDPSENARRIAHPDRRLNRKLMDPAVLATLRQTHQLLHHDTANIRLDVTNLTAPEAARSLHSSIAATVR